mmetsp:Transcript_13355/g.31521  ORF Transcript_13355/g.31521 Transcript_13355/m.31521 type:complete len:101 (-) Transcript_13355:1262-1564(-)
MDERFKAIRNQTSDLPEGLTLHSYRSGCAVDMYLDGEPMLNIMKQIGWSTVQTARRYLQLNRLHTGQLVPNKRAKSETLGGNQPPHKVAQIEKRWGKHHT